MDILRTPDERFQNLPDYAFDPHYIIINELRMHYVDEGAGDEVILCLHGEPTWFYLYRHIIPPLAEHYRVIAPDLIGFGKSDKLPNLSDYTYHFHHDMLVGFIESLDLNNITLICQNWGGVLGLPIAAELWDRFSRLVVLNTFMPTGEEKASEAFLQWRAFAEKIGTQLNVGQLIAQTITSYELPEDIIAAYDAPFPDNSYKAGAAQFPLIVPISADDAGAQEIKAARAKLAQWDKPALVMFSDNDPILGRAVGFFRRLLPTAKDQPEIVIQGAGHFLQEEKGADIAHYVHEFMKRTS